MEATSSSTTSTSSEDYTEQQETPLDTPTKKEDKTTAKNWNPSKSQRRLRFEPDEVAGLKEAPQIGRWAPPGASGLDENHVKYLAGEIAAKGQLSDVVCKKDTDGSPLLIYGRHRKAAILLINSDPSQWTGPLGAPLTEPLPLYYSYRNMSEEDAIHAAFSENTGLPLSCVDLAHAAVSFERLGLSNDQIAKKISAPHHPVSYQRVVILKSYMRLPTSILVRMHRHQMPESAARAMLQMKMDSMAMEEMARDLDAGRINAGQIVAMAKEEARKRGRKCRRTIKDVYELLESLDTADSEDFKSWLDGEHNDTERVSQIFTRCEDDEDGEVEEAKGSNLVGDGWELMEDDGETQLYMKGSKVKRVRKS